jgi:hypothetical protein
MDIQELRNLTTGRLHTDMGAVYKGVEFITGAPGVMTHMLPSAFRAMQPWLRSKVTDPRFWDGEYDTTHTGVFPLQPMNTEEQNEFWARMAEQPDPLAGKTVVTVAI